MLLMTMKYSVNEYHLYPIIRYLDIVCIIFFFFIINFTARNIFGHTCFVYVLDYFLLGKTPPRS